MKTDALFVVHSFKIPIRSGKPFRLVFFGDVHRDSPNHAKGAWQDFLKYAQGLKDAWFFGMGDYTDSTSTSERGCLAATAAAYHETLHNDLEELQVMKVQLLAKELGFMKGRLIGLLNGNHYFKFQDGTNTDQKLCGLLGCKYLGVSNFTRLVLDDHGRRKSLDIWAHHGSGAGRLIGGSLNRVDQMREHAEADIYAMGHDHKRGIVPATPRLFLHSTGKSGMSVRSRQQWLIRSGSFLASYENGKRNYNVDAGRGPCSLGHVEMIITPLGGNRADNPLELQIQGVT